MQSVILEIATICVHISVLLCMTFVVGYNGGGVLRMFHSESSSKMVGVKEPEQPPQSETTVAYNRVVKMLTELVDDLERVCSQNLFASFSPQEINEALTTWYELAYTSLQSVRELPPSATSARPARVADALSRYRIERKVPTENAHTMPLSDREYEVVTLLARCMTPREIANHLGVSEKTVRNHLSHTCYKLGCRDRVQVVLYALQEGWVTLDPPPFLAPQ